MEKINAWTPLSFILIRSTCVQFVHNNWWVLYTFHYFLVFPSLTVSDQVNLFGTEKHVEKEHVLLLCQLKNSLRNRDICRWSKMSFSFESVELFLSKSISQKRVSDWKPELRLPSDSTYIVLNSLEWNTEYEVHVVAENEQGKSKPGILTFKTDTEPTTVPGTVPIIPTPSIHTHQPQCT